MGTDMSIFAERLVDGSWRPVPEPTVRSGQLTPTRALDIGRPYELLSILHGQSIGLRSRLSAIPTTFAPRGFPQDMNALYRDTFAKWYDETYYFGASWILVSELRAFDWGQPMEQHAYVEKRYAALFDRDRPFPAAFPKDGKLYHGLLQPPPDRTVEVAWSVSVREFAGCSDWFIETLSALAPGDEVRVIFWFDA